MSRMVSKTFLSEKVVKLVIKVPLIAKSHRVGHFVIVHVISHSERVPYIIADTDIDAGTITLIVQAVGESSQQLVALNAGGVIRDVMSPLGQATHIENFDAVVCAGGGVGMTPLYPVAKTLKTAGGKIIVVTAARTRELIILEKEFGEFADEVIIMADDGSYGIKGLVTDGVESVIKREKVGLCVTVGPAIMMRFVALLTKKYDIPTTSSLDAIMADGIGMCGACRITVGDKTRFVCVDEPEFDAHRIDFGKLLVRLNTCRK